MDEDIFKNIIKVTMNIKDEQEDALPEEETYMCSNCNEFVPDDYGRHTEHDGFVCFQCLEDGFGE